MIWWIVGVVFAYALGYITGHAVGEARGYSQAAGYVEDELKEIRRE